MAVAPINLHIGLFVPARINLTGKELAGLMTQAPGINTTAASLPESAHVYNDILSVYQHVSLL